MSVPFYPFNSLPLKLQNKGMNFLFFPLKLPNKRDGRIFLKYSFHFIPFSPPKRSLKLSNKGMNFSFSPLKLPNNGSEEYSKIVFLILFHSIPFLPPKQGLSVHLVGSNPNHGWE